MRHRTRQALDFGLATHVHAAAESHEAPTVARLTDPAARVGTPAYMSPEQTLGAPLDPRSDLFSMAVVLRELASGHHPFQRATVGETMAAILRDPPISTEGDLDLVPGLGRIVHRCSPRPVPSATRRRASCAPTSTRCASSRGT